jgi:WD40 repeat protein
MELVKGISIVEYCDQQQLTARERLELLLSVCHAVQHAHSKGVIHRDIKPGNVLVAPHDGVPAIKVIDFGVAKAIGQRLTDKTIYTRFTQLIGTPLYMSPEQAEINALDVDIRSDVYSLGVLLYELLTGATPYDRKRFETAAFDEIRRIIREEEPPRPSTRLSTLGETVTAVSVRRKTDPARLSALMKGDLDWMVMKAMEKDRNRRYATANAFASDVERFPRNESILARPPSTAYKLTKFVKRNRLAVVTVAAVAAALVVGTGVATWQAVRATLAELDTRRERDLTTAAKTEATRQRDQARDANAQLQATQQVLRATLYAAHMNLIQSAWESVNVDRGQELLRLTVPAEGQPDPRGFEWHFWQRQFHSELNALAIPGSNLFSFNADGTRMSAVFGYAEGDRNFAVWDPSLGRRPVLLDPIFEPFESITPVSVISPNGQLVGSAVYEGSTVGPETRGGLMVWDTTTGKALYVTKSDSGPVDSATFSPDGKLLIGVSGKSWYVNDDEVIVWDAATGEELRVVTVEGGKPDGLVFSADSKRFAAIVRIGFVQNKREPLGVEAQIWDVGTGERLLTVPLNQFRGLDIENLAFSPDGAWLAVDQSSVEHPSVLRIFDAQNAVELFSLQGPIGMGTCLAFSHDGTRLARAGSDGTLVVWDVDARRSESNPQPRAVLRSHSGGISSIAFSADSKRLITAGLWNGYSSEMAGLVKTWDVTADQRPRILTGPVGQAESIAFSADGSRVIAAGFTGHAGGETPVRVRVWDRSGAERGSFQSPARPKDWFGIENSVAISRNGARVAVAVSGIDQPTDRDDGMMCAWDVATGNELFTLDSRPGNYFGVAFSPDGNHLASTWIERDYSDMKVRTSPIHILDASNGQVLVSLSPRPNTLPTWHSPSVPTASSSLAEFPG